MTRSVRTASAARLRWIVVATSLLLGACGGRLVPPGETNAPEVRGRALSAVRHIPARSGASGAIPPARQPIAAQPLPARPAVAVPGATSAMAAGVVAGPPVATLPLTRAGAAAALAAFRISCSSLVRRTDASGLTRPDDWRTVCDVAARTDAGDAVDFFAARFEAVQIGDGRAFATGYYIPEIAASLDRRAGYDAPIYARPDDLVDVDLGQFSDALKGRKIRGRVSGTAFVPYHDRAAIEDGAIGGHARVLAWAADPVALFFLQVQGSGLLRLPDGSLMRIGYDTQNGRDYTGIGALMKQRGLLAPGQATMQGIVGWLHDHPDEGRRIMDENRSFVFFRRLASDPVGSLGTAVAGGVSAAVDPRFVPLGAPVFLSMDRTDASRLWIAQDTGGAIKGANRVDTFWGSGDEAAAVAGGMSARGTAFLLLPIGTLARAGVSPSTEDVGDGGAAPR